jgi:hypothetical protein
MALAAYNSSVLITAQPSIATTNEATSTSDLTTFTISTAAHRYFDPTVAVVTQAQYDETQSITITGAPTGGTFTLTFGGNTTAAINWNDPASTVQTRLQALASIGAGNALVTGGPGPATPFIVEFAGTMAKTSEALITLTTNSLTGGSSPSVAIARIQGGATWATITTGFTLYRCNARVTFAVAQVAGTQVRFSSANYFVYATFVDVGSGDFGAKMLMDDTTIFNSAGAKSYIPTLLDGQLKLTTFWISQVRITSLIARDLLVVSFVLSTGNRYEGFCYASDMDLKYDPKKAIVQDITFQLTNEFFNA